MSEQYLGEISLVPYNFAPRQYAYCRGKLFDINQNQVLFAIVGGYFGGDYETVFGLPDFRGRIPIHAGQGPGLNHCQYSSRYGYNEITLFENNIPEHSHTINLKTQRPDIGLDIFDPQTIISAARDSDQRRFDLYDYTSNNIDTMHPSAISTFGANSSYPNNQPTLGIDFMMCIDGIFPSRG